ARERPPGMMRKLLQFITRLFGILMKMLLDIEDEAAWHTAENEDEAAGESSNYTEGCSKVMMIKNLEQVVSMVLNSFQDPHPRARWAAINAIGQLATDLGPDLQVQFHQRLLPALAGAMDDSNNPRVQAHAASVVLNFSENCTPDILTPDGIVSKLLVLLQNGKQMVQQGALTALASVADSSQANRMLRAKAMECVSLVGMAVGKDKFRDDAKQ
ncbi:putative TOG domain, importin beta family protein, partial [Tanacetum coccineum]